MISLFANKSIKHLVLIMLLFASVLILSTCDPRTPTPVVSSPTDYHFSLSADPAIIYADNGKTTAEITAFLTLSDGIPINGATILFYPSQGKMAGAKNTDQTGRATSVFDDDGQAGSSVIIFAQYTDEDEITIRDTISIQVLPMEALVDTFFVDTQPANGILEVDSLEESSTVTITSHVFDAVGTPVENVQVDFAIIDNLDGVGYIDKSGDSTNAAGVTRTTFHTNIGKTGNVQVVASISTNSLERVMENNPGFYEFDSPVLAKIAEGSAIVFADTVLVQAIAAPAISIELTALDTLIYDDEGESLAEIIARVRDTHGSPMDSVAVQFACTMGSINSPRYTNDAGIASTIFSDLGSLYTEDTRVTILGRVDHSFYGIIEDSVHVLVRKDISDLPRFPAYINLTAEYDELPPADNPDTTQSSLTAYVSDSTGYPVEEGTEVTFGTNIGVVTPFTLTDAEGFAQAVYTMGDSSGLAKIYAYAGEAVDSVLIHVRPTEAAYIIIPPVVPREIVVQGGWGAESTTLQAELRDASGELVEQTYDVTFSIGPSPLGANLNGIGNEVTVETNYGVASVTLNSGEASGPVQLTVSTTTSEGSVISSTGTPVTIISGPPYVVTVDGNINDIVPIGGGFYEMEVAAVAWDRFTNPVEDSTQIYWSLEPDTVADIIGQSYTNNENLDGDHYHGIAWSRLYYNSGSIFDTIHVKALTWGAGGDSILGYLNADADSTFLLPYLPGVLSLSTSIAFHDFGTDPTNPVPVVLTAFLVDYYGNPVNNGRILFQGVGVSAFEDMEGNTLEVPVVRTNAQGIAQLVVYFDRSLCVPNYDLSDPPEVISYDPFAAFVWCMLLDPIQVSSDEQTIDLRRSIP